MGNCCEADMTITIPEILEQYLPKIILVIKTIIVIGAGASGQLQLGYKISNYQIICLEQGDEVNPKSMTIFQMNGREISYSNITKIQI